MLADEVGEVDSYGGRLLPILDLVYAGPGRNLLVLEREPDAALADYFRTTAGLSLPDVEIMPHRDYLEIGRTMDRSEEWSSPAIERLREHSSDMLDGYVTDTILRDLADRLGMTTASTHEGSLNGNNKWLLHLHLEKVGLPVPATEIAGNPGEVPACLEKLERAGYAAAVIRAPLGASGIGMIKVPSTAEGKAESDLVPLHFFSEGSCLVQGWMQPGEFGVTEVRSPSVQLFLREGSVSMYDITEQILSHASVHEGNESPPPYLAELPELREELLRQAGVAGTWLHEQGYRGAGSVDFLVTTKEDGSREVYVCEINARVTGATYPSVLARHFLPEGAWLLRNLRFDAPVTGKELLDLLETSGDLYVPGRSEFGVLPVNFNFGSDHLVHKGQFLCLASSPRESNVLLRMAELDLPCRIDRD